MPSILYKLSLPGAHWPQTRRGVLLQRHQILCTYVNLAQAGGRQDPNPLILLNWTLWDPSLCGERSRRSAQLLSMYQFPLLTESAVEQAQGFPHFRCELFFFSFPLPLLLLLVVTAPKINEALRATGDRQKTILDEKGFISLSDLQL